LPHWRKKWRLSEDEIINGKLLSAKIILKLPTKHLAYRLKEDAVRWARETEVKIEQGLYQNS
jgi:hypothetical protein